MIEKTIIDYLTDNLSVPVYAEVPAKDIPSTFVIVSRTGGGGQNRLHEASIAVQSYAGSLYGAATLNETIKEKMDNIVELSSVSHCELNSDYNFTDTEQKRYRYQAIFNLIHY